MPRLVLMCGLPGAGKTTMAVRVADELGAVRLCPDEWLTDLGFDLWDDAARQRVERRLSALAVDLLGLGQSVVLEHGFWSRAERDEARLAARSLGASVELRYLDVSLDELWRRVAARNEAWAAATGAAPITRAHLEEWARIFDPPNDGEFALFD